MLEEGASEDQSTAGVLSNFSDAVFGRNGRYLDDSVAADGAAGATITSHRVFPGIVTQIEGGVVGTKGDPIQVVEAARNFHRRFSRTPTFAGSTHPAGIGVIVFGLWVRKAGHHVLIIPAQD